MGVCYSEEQQWNSGHKNYRDRRKKLKLKANSIIYQEGSIYQVSFNSKVENSFKQQQNPLLSILNEESSIVLGSISQLNKNDQELLQKSLQTINSYGQIHKDSQIFSLSNLKNKSFLHTHKIKLPNMPKQNQVSCCPYNSGHIIQYDLWKLVPTQIQDKYFIYHPFTQKFLAIKNNQVVCSEDKMQWMIKSFGIRRNGGFIKIISERGELCMTSSKGLLSKHRKLAICQQLHIGHLWQIKFNEMFDIKIENN